MVKPAKPTYSNSLVIRLFLTCPRFHSYVQIGVPLWRCLVTESKHAVRFSTGLQFAEKYGAESAATKLFPNGKVRLWNMPAVDVILRSPRNEETFSNVGLLFRPFGPRIQGDSGFCHFDNDHHLHKHLKPNILPCVPSHRANNAEKQFSMEAQNDMNNTF